MKLAAAPAEIAPGRRPAVVLYVDRPVTHKESRDELVRRQASRHHLAMARPHPLPLVALVLVVCGPGDQGSSTGSSTASTTSTSSSTDPGATDPASTSAPTTGTTITASATTSDTSDTTGAPPVCGEQSCQAGEVCVLPCCGGPPPGCSEPEGGMCPGGQAPVPSDQCQFNPCAGPLCCLPVACTPDPPFCIAPAMLNCNDNSCSINSCFGTLNGDRLDCQCA